MVDFKKEAHDIKDKLISIRRHFHSYPELDFETKKTADYIKNILKENNIEFKTSGVSGVIGIIRGTKNGNNKIIALRADIDALPIKEENKVSYASKIDGKMHACGHDAHATVLLGAAMILNRHKDEFSGIVKLFFEPAEETTGGAVKMIQEGALENPSPEGILGLHVDENVSTGKIMIKNGVVNAASNPFKVKIIGKGGHGAYPSHSVDPVVITSHIILALQTIVSREISPVNPAVISIGMINAGSAANVIPKDVVFEGMIRTMTKEDREFAIKRLKEIVNGIAQSSRAKAEIEIVESYPCLYNDDKFVKLIRESAEEIIGKENVLEQKAPKMGVESFAYFANEKPSAFYFLGSGNEEKCTTEPAHCSTFNVDEDCLEIGASIQALAAFKFLNN
ncbi:M20 family metallopeptidase [Clostridium sp. BJN0001]|uniref:M20 metallopeptidase family protein n=1 Tax=Clostridium sp. BJN0001 TaxID=2930219 RepID=UPI001FD5AC5A|nr:M20 family metallopeptidase [Clostridium sp. BJN0001]